MVNIINYLLQNCQRWQIGIFADSKSFFFFHQKVGVAWYFTPFFNSKQRTKDDKVVYVTEECLPFASNLQNSANIFFLHFRTTFLVYLNLQLVVQLILGMIFFAATDLPLLFVHYRPNWCFLSLTFQPVCWYAVSSMTTAFTAFLTRYFMAASSSSWIFSSVKFLPWFHWILLLLTKQTLGNLIED